MKKTILLFSGIVLIQLYCCRKENEIEVPEINFNPSIAYDSMTDQDGNIYKTVTIGTQVWMAENLRTAKYRNGKPIPEISDAAQWQKLYYSGAYCKYNNDPVYVNAYGYLYNWNAAGDTLNNIAPVGWHVPTIEEFNTLLAYLGGPDEAAKFLIETGEAHWNCRGNRNTGATNESGFTALPGGVRYSYYEYIPDKMSTPVYVDLSCIGSWWTATRPVENYSCPDCAYTFNLYGWNEPVDITTDGYYKYNGRSVRCVKD
jgi:uncharacterized protein (TIGR02145 family)